MIGNTIIFRQYDWEAPRDAEGKIKSVDIEGLVVDAFTEITGSVSGKTEVFLGFGEGKTTGSTNSNRIYKVQHHYAWDDKKKYTPVFTDVRAEMLVKITRFANQPDQEINEEKFAQP